MQKQTKRRYLLFFIHLCSNYLITWLMQFSACIFGTNTGKNIQGATTASKLRKQTHNTLFWWLWDVVCRHGTTGWNINDVPCYFSKLHSTVKLKFEYSFCSSFYWELKNLWCTKVNSLYISRPRALKGKWKLPLSTRANIIWSFIGKWALLEMCTSVMIC